MPDRASSSGSPLPVWMSGKYTKERSVATHTTTLSQDFETDDLRMYFKLSLSYTWYVGSDASEHEPKSESHPEDIRCVGVILMSSIGRLAGYDDHDKAKLIEFFNGMLANDAEFHERAVAACFEKEAVDYETALAERDESRARKWDE